MDTVRTQRRDAAATRNAILVAAKRLFTTKGFEGVGVREIAADAGVTAALVNRYFGSKVGLFEEAVIPALNIDELMAGDRSTFGARAAVYFTTKSHDNNDLDPTVAFVRSAGSATVIPLVSEAIEKTVVERLAQWLGGADPKQRAALIISHLAGFDMMRRIVNVDALTSEHLEAITPRFAQVIQGYVDDCL